MTTLMRRAHAARWPHLAIVLIALVVVLLPIRLAAVEIDGVQITLQSQKYYAKWDMTRLVYRVKGEPVGESAVWLLGLESCVSADTVDIAASSSFAWTETPVRGLLFDRVKANQKFYVWLYGQWELGPVTVGAGDGAGFSFAEMDGPSCGSSGISIEVVHGGAIAFPNPDGAGRFPAEDETLLRVSAASAGWALSHTLDFDLPDEASEEIVRKVFQVIVEAHSSSVATSELTVTYVVEIQDEDLFGLPQGDYGVTIGFTVSTD